MNTMTMPATVRELAEQAVERGMQPSEYLAALMSPPAGFVQEPDALQPELLSDIYSGPSFEGDGWKITTHWNAEEGMTFYVDASGDNAIRGKEVGKIAAALAEVARLTA